MRADGLRLEFVVVVSEEQHLAVLGEVLHVAVIRLAEVLESVVHFRLELCAAALRFEEIFGCAGVLLVVAGPEHVFGLAQEHIGHFHLCLGHIQLHGRLVELSVTVKIAEYGLA